MLERLRIALGLDPFIPGRGVKQISITFPIPRIMGNLRHFTSQNLPILCVMLSTGFLFGHLGACAQTPAFDQAIVDADLSTKLANIQTLVDATDGQGNTLYAGTFSGTLTLGPTSLVSAGGQDVFAAKRTPAGTWLWAIRAGGTTNERAGGAVVDAAGDLYFTGRFLSPNATFGGTTLTNANAPGASLKDDAFVAKVSGTSGAWLWATSAGGGTQISGDDYGVDVALDGQGHVYATGGFDSPQLNLGTLRLLNEIQGQNVFVGQLDAATGTWLWARGGSAGGGAHAVTAMAADAQGNAYLTGSFAGSATYGLFTVTNSAGGYPLFVAKIGPTGTWQWVTAAQTSSTYSDINGKRLVFENGRPRAYLAGNFSSPAALFGPTTLINTGGQQQGSFYFYSDAFVAQLNTTTGAWRWAVRGGGVGDDNLSLALPDGVGHLYVGGHFSPIRPPQTGPPGATFGTTTVYTAGGTDGVVAQLDTAGTWQWAIRAGGSGDDGLGPVAFDAQGRVLLRGSFNGATSVIGPITLTAVAGVSSTLFKARLLPQGPLATQSTSGTSAFTIWPNPAKRTVSVGGLAPGHPVQILDLLGRTIGHGDMPATGPLRVDFAPGTAAGVYIVRAGTQARHLVLE